MPRGIHSHVPGATTHLLLLQVLRPLNRCHANYSSPRSIKAKSFTLVFDHIHLAPNQIPPQTSVTTNLPSDALASTTTRAAEHQLHFSTIAVSEVDDTLLEGFSVSGPLKMGLWLVLSVLGQFSVL
jgi:hypothetical protein